MSIFSFLANIGRWIGNLFDKGAEFAREIAPKVIGVVNGIKNFDTDHPEVLDFITGVIPGDFDNMLKDKMRASIIKWLPVVQPYETCLELQDPNQMLICLTAEIQKIPDLKVRAQKWANLAALIASDLEDGKLDINEIAVIIKSVYDDLKNKE